ncbi:MAG TPA: hypothetical protein VKA46_14695, partial [Gemmataceae bacterium]|nr:hypothetical protein [Gemmataceae bacterium]
MAAARWRLGFAGALLLAALIGRAADAPPGGDGKMPREPEKPTAPDEVKPTVTLSAKEYQNLLDKIARLEGPAKAEPPSSCEISGSVAGDIAHLKIQFRFHTTQRKARVSLACREGYATKAEIDGHSPQLSWGADGHSVQVEDPGEHLVLLEMDLLLATRERGAERGLDLDLPAAAVTTLDLELPPGVKKPLLRTTVRGETVPGKPAPTPVVKTESPANGPTRLKPPALGPVERLELTWEAQAPDTGPAVLNVISSRILVKVGERQVNTSATITLGVRRGQLKEVQLLLPPQASVSAPGAEDRGVHIDPPKGPLHTVRLSKPTSDPLTLTIEVPQQASDAPVPVGPFVVLGAVPQRGDILVTAPAEMTLDYQRRGESQYLLAQREPAEDEKPKDTTVLAFRYSTLPGVEKAAPPPPFLQLLVAQRKFVVEAYVTHNLRLAPEGGGGRSAWRLITAIELGMNGPRLERLQVQLPRGYTYDEGAGVRLDGSGEVSAESPPNDSGNNPILGIQLTQRRKGAKLTFEGYYNPDKVTAGEAGEVTVGLPVLLGPKADRGGQVSVTLPSDLELLPRPGFLWEAGSSVGHNKRTAKTERWPERLEVAWQPYRAPLTVNGEARVMLQGRQASVTHRLWLPPPAPEQLVLTVPREAVGLTVVGEAEGPLRRDGKDGRTVQLVPPADRDHPLVLRYSFRLPEGAADSFPVPLVWPSKATGGETHVCVWSDPGTRPELKDGPWEVRRTEEVKDEGSYPSLVLVSRQPGAPLALGLGEAAGVALAAFRVEKALIQVVVGEGGQQTYRARFLLGQLASPALDVELPAQLFRPNPNPADVTVLFAGKLAAWKPVEDGKETAVSRTARVQVPGDLSGKAVVLEVNYTLLPGRAVLQTLLQAPQLRGDPGAAPVR